MSSSNSPCAACKFLRRKCTQECVFAPYFPPDNPQRFANVHKVFGASNVTKLLNELSTAQRDDAVKSLAYEAEARLRDPVYGCVGLISILQHKLKQMQSELDSAKKELATYIGPQAMLPILQPPGTIPQQHMGNPSTSMFPYNNMAGPMMGLPPRASHGGQLVIRDAQQNHHPPQHQQQQQIFDAQQMAVAVAREQEMLRSYEQQQQQQQELLRFNGAFDMGSASAGGFNHMSSAAGTGAVLSPSLALGTFDNAYHHLHPQQAENHHSHHHQLHPQLLFAPQQPHAQQQAPQSQQTQQQQHSESEEGRSGGPA